MVLSASAPAITWLLAHLTHALLTHFLFSSLSCLSWLLDSCSCHVLCSVFPSNLTQACFFFSWFIYLFFLSPQTQLSHQLLSETFPGEPLKVLPSCTVFAILLPSETISLISRLPHCRTPLNKRQAF